MVHFKKLNVAKLQMPTYKCKQYVTRRQCHNVQYLHMFVYIFIYIMNELISYTFLIQ